MRILEPLQKAIYDLWFSFLEHLPGLVLGLLVFVLFLIFSRYLKKGIRAILRKKYTDGFALTMGLLARWFVIAIGFFISTAVIFPSVSFGTLVGSLGVSSIAIGFAFKDILQNMLAGILLIFRQPFWIGDTIEVRGLKGIVQGISIRETRITAEDGTLIIIPNTDVYSSPLKVFPAATTS